MILSFLVLSKSAPRKVSKDMSTMKAVQVPHAGGAFELVERPLPEPQEGQVRIKVEACGVCHSDSTVKEGGVYPITYPRNPGHEVIGLIDAVGKDVRSWSVGQRVCVGWHGGHCLLCPACRHGAFTTCQHAQNAG